MKKLILNLCKEEGLLLSKDALDFLANLPDKTAVKDLLNNIKNKRPNKIITKDFLEKEKNSLSINDKSNRDDLNDNQDKNIKQDNLRKVSVKFFEGDTNKKIEVKDFVDMFRSRFSFMRGILLNNQSVKNPISIGRLSSSNFNKELFLVGMVYNKKVSKNNNIIFSIEDLTGRASLLVNKNKEEIYKKAEEVSLDSVLAFKCSGKGKFLFVDDIIFPDAFLEKKKKSNVEEYVAFISDLHFGSKKFLRDEFLSFIDYLNDLKREEVKKIKYLFIGGDLVSGVGVYPNQEEDLEIKDLEQQYIQLSEILSKIRKDITLIISPGNHDGVRLMEPQPPLDEKYAWPLYNLENAIITGNPAYVNIGKDQDFSGFNVLTYHGFSFPFYANSIPRLLLSKAMNSPEKIMEYLLKNRHLAPTHGSVQYYPIEEDAHLIRKCPDIFFSGHTHKSGILNYKNILIISGSSWEEKTSYQERFGNEPDHCKVPLFNLKTRKIKILDFENDKKDQLKKILLKNAN